MKQQCDNCGKLEDLCYTFEFDHVVFSYRLKFCYECGEAIKAIIDKGVQHKK